MDMHGTSVGDGAGEDVSDHISDSWKFSNSHTFCSIQENGLPFKIKASSQQCSICSEFTKFKSDR